MGPVREVGTRIVLLSSALTVKSRIHCHPAPLIFVQVSPLSADLKRPVPSSEFFFAPVVAAKTVPSGCANTLMHRFSASSPVSGIGVGSLRAAAIPLLNGGSKTSRRPSDRWVSPSPT